MIKCSFCGNEGITKQVASMLNKKPIALFYMSLRNVLYGKQEQKHIICSVCLIKFSKLKEVD